MRERSRAIDHAHAILFKMRQVVQRIENRVAKSALPRRRAHAIKQQRVLALSGSNIVGMLPRVDLLPVRPAFIELLEEWPEPVRMLVIDSDRLFLSPAISIRRFAHAPSLFSHQKLKKPLGLERL